MDDFDNDAAQYAALEREMAQPDPDLPGDGGEPYTAPAHQQAETEQYDSQRHGVPQATQQQQPAYEQQPQYQQQQLPHVDDDPIGHFEARAGRLEQAAMWQQQDGDQKRFIDYVVSSEESLRRELPDGEYDEACHHLEQGRIDELARQFPDTQQVALLAHSHGLRSPAELRNAILNRDRIMVSQHAAQNGVSPALMYYRLARERGFQSNTELTKTERKQLSRAIESAPDDDAFDRLWGVYEKVAQAEGGRR